MMHVVRMPMHTAHQARCIHKASCTSVRAYVHMMHMIHIHVYMCAWCTCICTSPLHMASRSHCGEGAPSPSSDEPPSDEPCGGEASRKLNAAASSTSTWNQTWWGVMKGVKKV